MDSLKGEICCCKRKVWWVVENCGKTDSWPSRIDSLHPIPLGVSAVVSVWKAWRLLCLITDTPITLLP